MQIHESSSPGGGSGGPSRPDSELVPVESPPRDFTGPEDHNGTGDACDLDDKVIGGGRGSKKPTAGLAAADSDGEIYRLDWIPEAAALAYNVYRVLLSDLSATNYGTCYRNGVARAYTEMPENPPASDGYGCLVTGISRAGRVSWAWTRRATFGRT